MKKTTMIAAGILLTMTIAWAAYGQAGGGGGRGRGGMMGPQMQKAVAALQEQVAKLKSLVDAGAKAMEGKTYADLSDEERAKIAELAAMLKQNPNYQVELEGYADPRGTDKYNVALSRRRVDAVRTALIEAGVPVAAIVTGAYGEMTLKCTEVNEACWQTDRRVEIKIVPGTMAAASPAMGNGK